MYPEPGQKWVYRNISGMTGRTGVIVTAVVGRNVAFVHDDLSLMLGATISLDEFVRVFEPKGESV